MGDIEMLINLWVKDKHTGDIHQVGTDTHDSINFIFGQPIYYNFQNGAGTPDEYEWVEPPDLDDYVSVTVDDLWMNKKLLHRDVVKMLEEREKMHDKR